MALGNAMRRLTKRGFIIQSMIYLAFQAPVIASPQAIMQLVGHTTTLLNGEASHQSKGQAGAGMSADVC